MEFVSEELVESTWRRVAGMTPQQIQRLQKGHRKLQPPMTVLLYHYFLESREDVAGVGLFVYHVVLEAFSGVVPRSKRIKKGQIESAWSTRMEAGLVTPQAVIDSSAEGAVMRYVYDALWDSEDEEVVLSESEKTGYLNALAAVVDCLHQACGREKR